MKKKTKYFLVKRKGHIEAYDERKVYGSAYGACMTVGMGEHECELVAKHVSGKVTSSVKQKKIKTTAQIAKKVAAELRKKNKDAAFMYETHRDIS